MTRLALFTVCLALLAPAHALAAPFGELPFRPVTQAATCLRATGAPGELVHLAGSSVELLTAGAQGAVRAAELDAERVTSCPRAAARPNGAGVIAVAVQDEDGVESLRAYLRDPGQSWKPAGEVLRPVPAAEANLPQPAIEFGDDVAAAASDRGDALIVASFASLGRAAVLVTRRAPGGAFVAPVTLLSARAGLSAPSVAAGLSASGEAVVAWAAQPRAGAPRALWVALAPRGGAFGPPQRIGELRPRSPFDLAVAADGRALLAFASGNELRVAERAPGGAFGAGVRVGTGDDLLTVMPAAALRADGAAVVAWTELLRGRATAVTRERPGPYGAPVALGPATTPAIDGLEFLLDLTELLLGSGDESGVNGASPDEHAGNPRATFAPDGRALVTWGGLARRGGITWLAPHAATLSPLEARPLGAELRDSGSVTPLLLADGRPALAWTDNADNEKRGRIHVAVEGAAERAEPALPRVTVRGPAQGVLGADSALPLTVTCSAACDVRVQAAGHFDAVTPLSLARAGTHEVVLSSELAPIAPLRTGPVKVLVRYGGPGARHTGTRTLTLRLRRRPGPPVPRVRGLSARRSDGRVRVRFETARPADPNALFVVGEGAGGELVAAGEVEGVARTRFTVVLEGAADVRRVTVIAGETFASSLRRRSVRVRG